MNESTGNQPIDPKDDFIFDDIPEEPKDPHPEGKHKPVDFASLGVKRKKDISEVLGDFKKVFDKADVGSRKAILVLLDGSGSMGDMMDMTKSKMDVAWNILKQQLAPNLSELVCGILVYWNDAGSPTYWAVNPAADMSAFLKKTAPRAEGYTPLGAGLHEAWKWLEDNADLARIIVLSDGLPNDIPRAAIFAGALLHKTIPIDTVGIGLGDFMAFYDPAFLKELSRITGGNYYEAGTVQKLAEVIKELAPKYRPLLGEVKQLGYRKPV